MDIPRARRVEVPQWVNTRTVVGLLLFLVSFVGAQRVLSDPPAGAALWIASRDLATGDVVTSADITAGRADLGDVAQQYAAESTGLIGAIVTRPIAAGEFIPVSSVARSSDSDLSRRVTIPIEVTHAVGGDLATGDLIDVFATFENGNEAGSTVVVARQVEVVDVVTVGGLVGDEGAVGVTVAVSAKDAPELVRAIRTALIDVVQVTLPASSEGEGPEE